MDLPIDLHHLELAQLATRIKARAVTSVAATQALLERIAAHPASP